jgi:hypothetical protein
MNWNNGKDGSVIDVEVIHVLNNEDRMLGFSLGSWLFPLPFNPARNLV